MSLRIIGGLWRSRRLIQPDTQATRPVPDRVRQTVFDILGNHYGTPGGLPPLRVADVFAGSGSMGLEALSRGANCCRFYERDRDALTALRRNIDAMSAGEQCAVVSGDAWAAAREVGAGVELIFLDPPYRDSEDASESGRVARFLRQAALAAPGNPVAEALVVLHHPRGTRFNPSPAAEWAVMDERPIGSNAVTIFRK